MSNGVKEYGQRGRNGNLKERHRETPSHEMSGRAGRLHYIKLLYTILLLCYSSDRLLERDDVGGQLGDDSVQDRTVDVGPVGRGLDCVVADYVAVSNVLVGMMEGEEGENRE